MLVITADHLDILHVWHVCWYMELVNRAHGQLAATVATKRIHITSPREEAVTAPARVIPTEILRTAVRNVGNLHTHTHHKVLPITPTDILTSLSKNWMNSITLTHPSVSSSGEKRLSIDSESLDPNCYTYEM